MSYTDASCQTVLLRFLAQLFLCRQTFIQLLLQILRQFGTSSDMMADYSTSHLHYVRSQVVFSFNSCEMFARSCPA